MKELYGEGLASHPDPKPCGRNPQGAGRSVGRGTREAGIELRNHAIPGTSKAQPVGKGEGNTARAVWLGPRRRPRSQRPGTREETSGSEPRDPVYARHAGRPPKVHSRTGGTYGTGGQTSAWYLRSNRTKGARIPRRRLWREGARPRGSKVNQTTPRAQNRCCCDRCWSPSSGRSHWGNCDWSDSRRSGAVNRKGTCVPSIPFRLYAKTQLPAPTPLPEVGAACGKAARADLSGGRRATGVPTGMCVG